MRSFRPIALVLLLCLGALPAAANGIYTYTRKDGAVVFTNVPPPKRTHARRLRGTFHPAPSLKSISATAIPPPAAYVPIIRKAAARYRIPAALVRAIMQAESNYDPHAISSKGAAGLMQLLPSTATAMFVKHLFAPKDNIEGAVRYLRVLANAFDGDMVKMVAAYNAGPDAVRKYGRVPPFPETQAYVRKVIQLYFQFQRRLGSRAEQADARTETDGAS